MIRLFRLIIRFVEFRKFITSRLKKICRIRQELVHEWGHALPLPQQQTAISNSNISFHNFVRLDIRRCAPLGIGLLEFALPCLQELSQTLRNVTLEQRFLSFPSREQSSIPRFSPLRLNEIIQTFQNAL